MKDLSVDVFLATASEEAARSMCSRKPAPNARRADAGCSPRGLVKSVRGPSGWCACCVSTVRCVNTVRCVTIYGILDPWVLPFGRILHQGLPAIAEPASSNAEYEFRVQFVNMQSRIYSSSTAPTCRPTGTKLRGK